MHLVTLATHIYRSFLCALQKYSDRILEALAMHLSFPGHLFSGLFLLSLIWITASFFIHTLFDSHSFSILSCSHCLLHIHFLFDCHFFSRLSCTNHLCFLHFLSDSHSRSLYSVSLLFCHKLSLCFFSLLLCMFLLMLCYMISLQLLLYCIDLFCILY